MVAPAATGGDETKCGTISAAAAYYRVHEGTPGPGLLNVPMGSVKMW
jgi:hypothetical protein